MNMTKKTEREPPTVLNCLAVLRHILYKSNGWPSYLHQPASPASHKSISFQYQSLGAKTISFQCQSNLIPTIILHTSNMLVP